jgi:hypothetical protein
VWLTGNDVECIFNAMSGDAGAKLQVFECSPTASPTPSRRTVWGLPKEDEDVSWRYAIIITSSQSHWEALELHDSPPANSAAALGVHDGGGTHSSSGSGIAGSDGYFYHDDEDAMQQAIAASLAQTNGDASSDASSDDYYTPRDDEDPPSPTTALSTAMGVNRGAAQTALALSNNDPNRAAELIAEHNEAHIQLSGD